MVITLQNNYLFTAYVCAYMYVFVTCLAPRRVGLAGGVEVLVVCHISLSLVNMLVLREQRLNLDLKPSLPLLEGRKGKGE